MRADELVATAGDRDHETSDVEICQDALQERPEMKSLARESADARHAGLKTAIRRYMCFTRRYGNACGEPIIKAEPLERRLVNWLRSFQPQRELLDLLLESLQAASDAGRRTPHDRQRGALLDQLKRLQDLYDYPHHRALSRAAEAIRSAAEHGRAQAHAAELLAAWRDGESPEEIAGRLSLRVRWVMEVIRANVTDADRAVHSQARRSRGTSRHRGSRRGRVGFRGRQLVPVIPARCT